MVVEVGGEKKLRRILPFWRCCGPGTGDLVRGSEAFNNPLARGGEVSGDCPAAALWWATLKHWADERRARAGWSLHPARACAAPPGVFQVSSFPSCCGHSGFSSYLVSLLLCTWAHTWVLHVKYQERGVVVLFVLLRHFWATHYPH